MDHEDNMFRKVAGFLIIVLGIGSSQGVQALSESDSLEIQKNCKNICENYCAPSESSNSKTISSDESCGACIENCLSNQIKTVS